MKDKEKLLQYVMEQFSLDKEDFKWDPDTINPTEGFHKGKEGTQVSNAGLGYWSLTLKACDKLIRRRYDNGETGLCI